MACLNHSDPGLDSNIPLPLNLGGINGESSSLHTEGDLLTVVYSVSVKKGVCFDKESGKGNHSVKIHFLCPSGNEVRSLVPVLKTAYKCSYMLP